MVSWAPTPLPGVGLVRPPFHEDVRGAFTKVMSAAVREATGLDLDVDEVYWSRSEAGVVRGLHFQVPPAEVAKVVFVPSGRIRDVVLDLRPDSPAYGLVAEFELDPSAGAVVVPRGCAHGFEVLEGPAITCYLQDGPFDPDADSGVRWDSAGIEWRTAEPVLSTRDLGLAPLDLARSPFATGQDG